MFYVYTKEIVDNFQYMRAYNYVVLGMRMLGILTVLLSLVSCKVAETVVFEHQPSSSFYVTGDRDDTLLKPYIYEDTVVIASIKQSSHDAYSIWVTKCGAIGIADVRLKAAHLSRDKWSVDFPVAEIAPHTTEILGERCMEWHLGDVSATDLLGVNTDSHDVHLSIEVSGRHEKSKRLIYLFTAKRERRIVFPT